MTTSTPSSVTTSTAPIPNQNPEAFYRATIGGVLTPGAIPPDGIEGWDLVFEWDVKAGKGFNDATITDKGAKPPEGKITYQIWRDGTQDGDPNDHADDDAFAAMLIAAKQNNQALDVVHPIINQQLVASVVPTSIGAKSYAGAGLWKRTIGFLKWVPQVTAAGGTPGSSTEKEEGATPEQEQNDPNSALKKEFADKVDEASAD